MVNTQQIASDVINALIPNLIGGARTLVSYQNTFANMYAKMVADIDEKRQKNQITEAEAENLLQTAESMILVSIDTQDVIRSATKAKAANAVLKVLQTAVNTATGFSIALI